MMEMILIIIIVFTSLCYISWENYLYTNQLLVYSRSDFFSLYTSCWKDTFFRSFFYMMMRQYPVHIAIGIAAMFYWNSFIQYFVLCFGTIGINVEWLYCLQKTRGFHGDENVPDLDSSDDPDSVYDSSNEEMKHLKKEQSTETRVERPPEWLVYDPVVGVVEKQVHEVWQRKRHCATVVNEQRIPPVRRFNK